jgi:hypothetical protein
MSYWQSLTSGIFSQVGLRRFLPLAAGLLLLLVLFQQLRRRRLIPAAAAVGPYGVGRRMVAGLVGLTLPALVAGLALLVVGVQLPSPLRHLPRAGAPTLDRTAAGGRPAKTVPSPRGPKILAPDPASVTLQTGDLPPGYHVLKASKASFSSGGIDAYPSWDVVFEPDTGNQAAAYPLAESLAVVYPNAGAASRAIETQSAADRSGGAAQFVPLSKLGDEVTVWVEKTSNRPEFRVVRVTWRYDNVVGQVSTLTPAGAPHPEQTLQLATVEQERLKARAPTVQTLSN